MINSYRNETASTQKVCLFNSMFDRGRLVAVAPNQVIATCEHCSQTIVQDLEEAQSLHIGKSIEDMSVRVATPIPPMPQRERGGGL